MIRSNLIKFLNKHTCIQLVVCFLPILFIIVYIFAYMFDVSGLISVFEYNNKMTMEDMASDLIKEVSFFEENADGTYTVIIEDSDSVEEDIDLGMTIYNVTLLDDSWFAVVTKSGERMYQTECDLFGVEPLDDGRYKIIVDDKSFEIDKNSIVCDVVLNKDGDYDIMFVDESIPVKTVDYISSLQVLVRNDNSYRIKVSSAYEKKFDSIDLKFCTNLPTDNVYYNETSQSFIKNVAKDFDKTFILGSNIIVVFLSMSLYCILLGVTRKQGELTMLKHKEILIADVIAVGALILCVAFTLIMF